MASVTSLDQDMKRLRMSRYTPQAAKEVRGWIEDTLGEQLPSSDLLELLKDGTILCKLVNRALPPPGIRFKKSSMPFVQMENISHFLRACESPPFNMQSHDRFLTVDLFEAKDPAQVLQCLTAFSRVANSLYPDKFPVAIGPKRNQNPISPSHTGASNGSANSDYHAAQGRGNSNAHHPTSPVRSTVGRPQSQAFTGPSSILYSGYMGGASQGNQGISFGGRRQITTPAPFVPSLADKERRRREKELEDEKLRQQADEAESRRIRELDAQEERDRNAEEKRWEEEAQRLREEEKARVEQEKKEWEEQERKWKEAEELRLKEEEAAQIRPHIDGSRSRGLSDARLRGQYLSEYQAEVKTRSRQTSYNDPERNERSKIEDLERQLAEAQERERQYQEERKRRDGQAPEPAARSRSRSRPPPEPVAVSPPTSNVSWTGDERDYLRKQHDEYNTPTKAPAQAPPSSHPGAASSPFSRPLPNPASIPKAPVSRPLPKAAEEDVTISRPLPNPEAYSSPAPAPNRTDRFLSHNKPPPITQPQTHHPAEFGFTSDAEKRAEDARRAQSQTKTRAGGWASKSLLEREMERERERQREWEEAQKEVRSAPKDPNAGVGAGQSWDVNQYGFTGGDSQNRGDSGIGFGAKRQIIGPRGPRPPPS